MRVLKIDYSLSGAKLICHGVDNVRYGGAGEDARLRQVVEEAAEWLRDDLDGSDGFPARLALLGPGLPWLEGGGRQVETAAALYEALVERLPLVAGGRRVEVRDAGGGVWTVTAAEMSPEECEALPEFDGW